MGILNITPDSFSDGGMYFDAAKAVDHGLRLIEEGADILDIGGESTRPGSDPISWKEERNRVIPVIKALRKRTDALISIDTTKYEISREALDVGADIINDISASRFDPRTLTLTAKKNVPIVLMHMKGRPKTMQIKPSYENLLSEVKSFFEERISTALTLGVKRDQIIIDPGIGFGKGLDHNCALINNLRYFEDMERPLLLGISRKSFIGQVLNLPPHERIEGTLASAVLSIVNGAHILRVHDVAPVRRAVRMAETIMGAHSFTGAGKRNKEKSQYVN